MYRFRRWLVLVIWTLSTACGSLDPTSDPRRPLQRDAFARYAAGDISGARQLFEKGLAQATDARDARDLSRFHSGLGLCDMANHHYSRALDEFQKALAAVRQVRAFPLQADLAASASSNIATAYARMGDRTNAIRATLDGLDYHPSPQQDSLLRLNLAIYYAEAGRPAESEKSFRELIARARQARDHQTLARSLENLGYQLTTQGRLPEAETALLESLQVRQANSDPELSDCYFPLARLRLAQHRPADAIADLDRYTGRSHYWIGRVHHLRGKIQQEAGQPALALASFRQAVTAARRRRSHIRPTENLLLSSELSLAGLYADFIHAASTEYTRSGRQEFLAEALAGAEELRVATQRAAYFSPDGWADQNPAYLKLLQQLDAAEFARTPASDPKLNRVHLALAENEAKMASDEPLLIPPEPDLATHLDLLRRSVAPSEAVFVFHVSPTGSLGWLITRERVVPARLPPAAELNALAGAFVNSLKNKANDSRTAGLQLFTKVFREFLPAAATKLHWSLVLDGPLFEIPFAVLPVPANADDLRLGRQPMLVDRHAISLMPSFFPERKVRADNVNKLFAGIGDPIYNAADPRFSGTLPRPGVELARLPGTATEIRRAAQIWEQAGYRTDLLMGVEASTGRLLQVVARQPSVLHLAAHVIPPAGTTDAGPRIAFSLSNGTLDSIGPRDFSRFRVPGTLVMMAGCASGRGAVLPGIGLVGLTRAWLLSGADAVVANLWPVPDDSGDFPVEFYFRLSQLKKNNKQDDESGSHRLAWARALRQAVIEARDSGRVPVLTWSAYYLMGRN